MAACPEFQTYSHFTYLSKHIRNRNITFQYYIHFKLQNIYFAEFSRSSTLLIIQSSHTYKTITNTCINTKCKCVGICLHLEKSEKTVIQYHGELQLCFCVFKHNKNTILPAADNPVSDSHLLHWQLKTHTHTHTLTFQTQIQTLAVNHLMLLWSD